MIKCDCGMKYKFIKEHSWYCSVLQEPGPEKDWILLGEASTSIVPTFFASQYGNWTLEVFEPKTKVAVYLCYSETPEDSLETDIWFPEDGKYATGTLPTGFPAYTLKRFTGGRGCMVRFIEYEE